MLRLFRRRAAANADPQAVTDFQGRAGDIGAMQARGIMSFYTAVTQGDAIRPGLIRWGERGGDMSAGGDRYSGDLGPLQQFATNYGGKIGNVDSQRPGFGSRLPATSTVGSAPPGDMLALLIQTDHYGTDTTRRQLTPRVGLAGAQ